jgi:SEC-C motif
MVSTALSHMTTASGYTALPAVCRDCGTIFRSPFGVPVGGSNTVVKFSRLNVGPCPKCFGMTGTMAASTVDLSRPDVIRALSAPDTADNLRSLVGVLAAASREELAAIQAALADTRDRAAPEVADALANAAPRLAGLSEWLRDRENLRDVAMWLTAGAAILNVILAILLLLATRSQAQAARPEQPIVTPQQVEQIIQAIAPQSPQSQPVPGRNQPCRCGSGLKYKHCHGAPPGRAWQV